MNDSQRRISNLIKESYAYVYYKMNDGHMEEYEKFIECNRGTYAFVSLISSFNEHLIHIGELVQESSTKEQMGKMSPYFDALIDYICNMPTEDKSQILLIKGAGADTLWLRKFQNAIRQHISSYNPDGLDSWLETQDKDLQEDGKKCGKLIENEVKSRVLSKLEDLYGSTWENQIKSIKGRCLMRMDDIEDDAQSWTDHMNLQDLKEIIDSKWLSQKEDDETFITFEKEFSIQVTDSFRTKTDKLKWLNDLILFSKSWTTTKGRALTQHEVNEMESILRSLMPTEEN